MFLSPGSSAFLENIGAADTRYGRDNMRDSKAKHLGTATS